MLLVTTVVTDVKFASHSTKKKMNMKETLVMVVVKGKKFSKERKQQNNFVIDLLMRETKTVQ